MLIVERLGPVVKFSAARAFGGRTFYRTAAYWVDGLLIDTTCAHTAQELRQALGSLDLHTIVNTHCHEDHIGANALLQNERDVRILAHPLALPVLSDPTLMYLQFYRHVFWGRPQPSRAAPIHEWVETPHYRFQVIHTPGHSPDHVCLYEPQRGWLFSGDAYIGGRDRAARPDYDMQAVISSLKRLAALYPMQLFPGSGTVRMADPAAEIEWKIAYLEELGESIRQLHGQGLAVGEIERRLLGPPSSITWLTHGHFRGKYLVEAYLREPSSKERQAQ